MTTVEPKKVYGVQMKDLPGKPWRHVSAQKELRTTVDGGYETVDELFRSSCKKFAGSKALGTREVLASENAWDHKLGRHCDKLTQGDYSWVTYGELDVRVNNIAKGLHLLGQASKVPIAIFGDTKADWMTVCQAGIRHNYPVMTVYATLGEEALGHALAETEVTHIVCDATLLPTLRNVMHRCPQLRTVIYMGNASNEAASDYDRSVRLLSLEDVEAEGSKQETVDFGPTPVASDTCVIMYTSGSTGMPKGVVLSHRNVLGILAGIVEGVPHVDSNDVYIGYLPLAHILELSAETVCLCNGASIGYSHTLTLSDASPRVKPGTRGDITTLRPTLMAAVPLVMDRVRKGVMDRVRGKGFVTRALFDYAYKRKMRRVAQGKTTTFWDRIVFKKIKDGMGGRVRLMLSGGAPLGADTQRFMRLCFDCDVLQGYGLTETCGGSTLMAAGDSTVGHVGPPLACCEVKLVDWEEGGYRASDAEDPAVGMPRGEVVVHGMNVAEGYFKNEAKTAEAFREEADGKRWFYTGDIGQFRPNGVLEIIDRKKDLVKLAHGEYVSLGKVEAVLKACPFVDNIMVHADPNQTFCVAVVAPDAAALRSTASDLGFGDFGFAEQCTQPDVVQVVMKELTKVGKSLKLAKFEIPAKIAITHVPWTPENELVTAALKLKRENLKRFYDPLLFELYQK